MAKYQKQTRVLLAIDCVVFGFDGQELKLLIVRRGIEPEINKLSLTGGFVLANESADEAAKRILKQRTGLEGVYLEQFYCFSQPARDPIERTVSVAYFALIDINLYQQQITAEYHPEWFSLKKIPKLIFDHDQMVAMAKQKLRYKAALHPILFELLPQKFTLPLLRNLFEDLYETSLDQRNFSRKILSTGLLEKQGDKDKTNSRKGAFFYKLDKKHYKKNIHKFQHLIPNPSDTVELLVRAEKS